MVAHCHRNKKSKMKILLFLLISLNLSAQLSDNTKHVYAGTLITIGTSEILKQCHVKPWKTALIGLGAGICAGAGKELIWDKALKRGTPDVWDFTSTGWGSLIGIAIEIPINDIKKRLRNNL